MIQSIIKKASLTVILFLTAVVGYSQTETDGDNMYLYTKSTNEATVYSIDEISKITFSKTGVQIWNTNWPTEYGYSNVRVLSFKEKGAPQAVQLAGDAYSDGKLNAADIVEMTNSIMNKQSDKFDARKADANSDRNVNISDIVKVARYVVQSKSRRK